jgi:hypothetical protein
VYEIILGGKTDHYSSSSNPIYGYDYDDGVNVIDGAYIEINQKSNVYQAIQVGEMNDFEFEFSCIKKEAVGYENERWPAIGLIFNNANGYESYLFQDKGAIVLIKGWSNTVKSEKVLNKSAYTVDVSFDFKITRKGNLITFYGKVSDEEVYEKVFEYTSTEDFSGCEARLTITAASTQVRYLVYNVKYTAL